MARRAPHAERVRRPVGTHLPRAPRQAAGAARAALITCQVMGAARNPR